METVNGKKYVAKIMLPRPKGVTFMGNEEAPNCEEFFFNLSSMLVPYADVAGEVEVPVELADALVAQGRIASYKVICYVPRPAKKGGKNK